MTYDELLEAADDLGLIAKEKDLQAHDGLIRGRRVAIRRSIQSQRRKACVLAEEIGHYFTTAGDIMDPTDAGSRKQERRARIWAHDVQVGLDGILAADAAGCRSVYEMADFLEVPEDFLIEAIGCYSERYGRGICYKGYRILFDPLEVRHGEDEDKEKDISEDQP